MFHNGDHKIYYIKWLHINMLNYISSQILNFKLKNITKETRHVKSLWNKILHNYFFKGKVMNGEMMILKICYSGGNDISYVEFFLWIMNDMWHDSWWGWRWNKTMKIIATVKILKVAIFLHFLCTNSLYKLFEVTWICT